MSDQWWYPAREPPERVPFRNKFDQARDPLTARNAIGAVDAKFVADAIAAAGGGSAPTTAQYVTAAADATLTAERVLTNTATVTWDFSTAGQAKATAVGGGNVSNSGTPTAGQYAKWVTATTIQGVEAGTVLADTGVQFPPQGRLTLQTATPVMITASLAATTLYYTPYVGNQVPIYNGTSMVMTAFAELSAATTDTTKSPAAIGASKVNDWFVWNDAGTVRVGHGPDWTSDTARSAGTALVRVNGILLNNVSITNGPAAQRGTYVGTTRSNASSQLDFSISSDMISSSPTCHLWNAYNRVSGRLNGLFSTASYVCVAGAIQSLNGSSTARINYVAGLQDDTMLVNLSGVYTATTGSSYRLGFGLDTASGLTGSSLSSHLTGATAADVGVKYTLGPQLGAHFLSVNEQATGGNITVVTAANLLFTCYMRY